jgi:hypothetical protein
LRKFAGGILEKPPGTKRDTLERWFSGPEGPQALITGRILPFDDKAGLIWAQLIAAGKKTGTPRRRSSTSTPAWHGLMQRWLNDRAVNGIVDVMHRD